MAGLAWLTCRHRPSEPRLVCDLSLLHRLPIGADSGQIGSVWPLAQGSGSCSCCSCWLLLLLALVAPAAPAGAGGSCSCWRWWLLLLLLLLLALVAPAAAGAGGSCCSCSCSCSCWRCWRWWLLLPLVCQSDHLHTGRVTAADPAPYWVSPKRIRPMQSPSRPAVFAPVAGQRRWVRDRHAAIRSRRQWVRLIRVDRPVAVMADAPYDHNDAGQWVQQSVSVWQIPCIGASFPSLAAAAAWIAAMPG